MTATEQATQLTGVMARAAASKLGQDIVAMDVSQPLVIADVFLLVSASNERQIGAIVDAIEEAALANGGRPPRREGRAENRWVLLDFYDVIVHVMQTDYRQLYSLERLWKDVPRVPTGIEPE